MERIYAFTDEYGQFGWDLSKPDVSSCFIITAVLVKESELQVFTDGAEEIRKRYFQTGEMKSSKVADNYRRRIRILQDLATLPFIFFPLVIRKQECLDNMSLKGLRYKPSFYKFMNNIVHKELRHAFDELTIVADEIGGNDYMESFCRYVDARQDVANLLGTAHFMFEKSTKDVRINVADFISGTLGRLYDANKRDEHAEEYFEIIKHQVYRIELYPKLYTDFSFDNSPMVSEYDLDIAKLCYSRAVTYLENNDIPASSDDEYQKGRNIVLKYLLFRFINNDQRGYVSTKELQGQLTHTELRDISEQTFRGKIIGALRDSKVIIASSSRGYKIPSRLAEIRDYVTHDAKVIIPMLSRLNRCRQLIKLNTMNAVDPIDGTEFEELKWYFDSFPNKDPEET